MTYSKDKELNIDFTNAEMKTAEKHLKNYSISLIIGNGN